MNKMMLHRGAELIEREELAKVETPKASGRWCPISHMSLLLEVQDALTNAGLRITDEKHGITPDMQRYFGMLELESAANADYTFLVGVRNTHDKKFPASIAMGSRVFVCDNLSFTGDKVVGRRHTINIMRDLPGLVAKAIEGLNNTRIQQDTRFKVYKETEINDVYAHDLMVKAMVAGIPVTYMDGVVKEWRTPRHPEFYKDGNTVWRLFNAYTEILKQTNINDLPARTIKLQGLLDNYCGITAGSFIDTSNAIEGEIIENSTALALVN